MVFAKIFPKGSDAEQALHLVYKDQISDHHRQFIQAVDTPEQSKRTELSTFSSSVPAIEQKALRLDLLFNILGYEKPQKALSAIPRHEDAKDGPVVLHGTMSQGASGWVYAAVHARNGEPLAVKEHRPKNKEAARNVMKELEIGSRFAVGGPVLDLVPQADM
ncbi:MAG: hypothetical protein Q9207_000018 [Kuettlingeria erythrocarpa]